MNNCEICDEAMEVVDFENGESGVKDGKFSVVRSWSKVEGSKYMKPNTKAINIHRKCGFKALADAGVNLYNLI